MSHRSRPAARAVVLVIALVMALGSAGVAGAVTTHHARRAAIATSSGCTTAGGCARITASCSEDCPTVRVSPDDGIAADQWVQVSLSKFAAGDNVTVYYCSLVHRLTAATPSPCILSSTPELQYPAQQVPITADGAGTAAVNVQADPRGNGDQPLSGEVPGDTSTTSKFYCDNGSNRCAIEVVDSSLSASGSPTPNPRTTAVVPLTFLPSAHGCPEATLINTASDFSAQVLLPALTAGTCKGSHPSLALNTANDLDAAARSLAAGDDAVLFTTDPQAADVRAILAKTGHRYADIPLVGTANVIATSASEEQQAGAQLIYPDNAYRLTPNMVAGLATYNYSSPFQSDVVPCPATSGSCSGLELLNTVNGFVPANQYGAFDPSEHTGVTDQLLSWLCKAPTLPYRAGGATVDDVNHASQTLTTSNYDSNWPIRSCTARDQLPAITSPSSSNFALLSDPSQQAKYLRGFAPPPAAQSNPVLGIAPMDWSQADFFGLATASLQNAHGSFVAPTRVSVTAALAAASVHAGVVTPSYTTSSAAAYPMPAVVYAVVRIGPGAAAADVGVRTLLSGLLAHAKEKALPQGYVALPASLATTASHEITTDVPATSGTSTGKKTGTSTGKKTGTSTGKEASTGSSPTPPNVTGGSSPDGSSPSASDTSPAAGRTVAIPTAAAADQQTVARSRLSSAGAALALPVILALAVASGLMSGGLRAWRRWAGR